MTRRNPIEAGGRARSRTERGAFTLIELLVVIAIIGVLASLIIPLSGIATTKMRIARVRAELNNYVTAIEGYKAEVGFYPPDNGDLKLANTNNPAGYAAYRTNLALNPLFYELVGCVFTNRQFYAVGGGEIVRPDELKSAFHLNGIQNSQRHKRDIAFKGFRMKPGMSAKLAPAYSGYPDAEVEILAVPVPGKFTIPGRNNAKINPWFYDSSSTNRNNRATYDLWAEIEAGGKTQIIGNWKN